MNSYKFGKCISRICIKMRNMSVYFSFWYEKQRFMWVFWEKYISLNWSEYASEKTRAKYVNSISFWRILLTNLIYMYYLIIPNWNYMTLSLWTNWWDHLQDLTTPYARQFKDDMWAKAWLLELLRQDPEIAPYIIPGFYISPDTLNKGSIPDLPQEFRSQTRLLYRSTNPHDAYDFIGQLPTLSGSTTTHTQVIGKIRTILAWHRLDSYLEKKWIPHQSQETGIYIQEQLPLRLRWSIVEHPHHRWIHLVSSTTANHGDNMHDNTHSVDLTAFSENWDILQWEHRPRCMTEMDLEAIKELILSYRKIQKMNVFEDGISFQTEFGISRNEGNPYILQVRQFRPFQKGRNNRYTPSWWDTTFWITPEAWINLNIQVVSGAFAKQIHTLIMPNVQWLVVPFLRDNMHPSAFEGMEFFSLGGNSHPSLEHHTYDAAMKIPNVILNPFSLPWNIREKYVPNWDQTDIYNVNYSSDGTRGKLILSEEVA